MRTQCGRGHPLVYWYTACWGPGLLWTDECGYTVSMFYTWTAERKTTECRIQKSVTYSVTNCCNLLRRIHKLDCSVCSICWKEQQWDYEVVYSWRYIHTSQRNRGEARFCTNWLAVVGSAENQWKRNKQNKKNSCLYTWQKSRWFFGIIFLHDH